MLVVGSLCWLVLVSRTSSREITFAGFYLCQWNRAEPAHARFELGQHATKLPRCIGWLAPTRSVGDSDRDRDRADDATRKKPGKLMRQLGANLTAFIWLFSFELP